MRYNCVQHGIRNTSPFSNTHSTPQLRKEKRELEETLESEQLSQVTHLQNKILKLESEVVRKQEALMEVTIMGVTPRECGF